MKKLNIIFLLLASPAFAQNAAVTEPVCEAIGRTSKVDLVYSMECRNIPGLPPGDKRIQSVTKGNDCTSSSSQSAGK